MEALGVNLYNQHYRVILDKGFENPAYTGTASIDSTNASGKVDYNNLQGSFETAVSEQIIAVEGTEEDID